MRFWDSSAIVPLLVAEPAHEVARREYARDPDVVAWWATPIECVSALARRERDGLSPGTVGEALRRLDGLAAAWQEVQPGEAVRRAAMRILRVHALRAADAAQLAAAIAASEGHPGTLPFITFDDRLAEAASREGFQTLHP
ncbi:MAG: type II toxin-antitoxin system VapC family toxin [Candidatus Limnocylindria bacterium]